MLLDSSVMNVAIATVAKDVGTTVTGIQTAITLYTLVMAMFMVTGGKLGSMFGRKRIFMIGCSQRLGTDRLVRAIPCARYPENAEINSRELKIT